MLFWFVKYSYDFAHLEKYSIVEQSLCSCFLYHSILEHIFHSCRFHVSLAPARFTMSCDAVVVFLKWLGQTFICDHDHSTGACLEQTR